MCEVSNMEPKKKSFIVKGNLKDKITYTFLPNELTQGQWWFRIQSLTYSINGAGIQSTCSVTCNLTTALQYANGMIINYEEPFGLILFEPKSKRKLVTFNEQWLKINVYSDEMILSVMSIDIGEKLTIDCDVIFLVQLSKKT